VYIYFYKTKRARFTEISFINV